jgi:hypothetical protein
MKEPAAAEHDDVAVVVRVRRLDAPRIFDGVEPSALIDAVGANAMPGGLAIRRMKFASLYTAIHARLNAIVSIFPTSYGIVVQIMKRNWWVSITSFAVVHSLWASLRYWLYRKIIPWERM